MEERILRFAYIQIFHGFIEKKLPDESCRLCGGSLIDFSQCAECKKIISMICRSCMTKTAEQYHNDCILGLNPPRYSPKNILENMERTALT